MLVTLPSGAIAPLEAPSLPSLLAAGGDLARIAACSFAHDEVTVDELFETDVLFVASWALGEFVETDEARELAVVCQTWGRAPSEALGLTDRVLAWTFDRALHIRLARLAETAPPDGEDEHVRFTSGGPDA